MTDEQRSRPATPAEEVARLSGELARIEAERDALLHLVLRSNGTTLGRLGRRWANYTRDHRWAERWVSRSTRLLWLLLTLRWPAGIRVNPLFDEAWYRGQYPDAPAGRRAAYRQYLRLSKAKGREPNPRFDTDWYLERNPDLVNSRWRPLDHYLYFGWREARDPGPDFDGFDYLRHHPDAVERAENPLLHSMRASPFEPKDPAAVRMPGPPPTVQRTITHYRRHGLRRTLGRAASEVGLSRRSVTLDPSSVDIAVTEREPRSVKAHLDTPRPGASEGSSALLVSGWAFSERVTEPVSVTVYLDGVLIEEAVSGQHRPDVGAMYRHTAASRDSGFSARVPLDAVPPGEHVVHVVARDAAGAVRILAQAFRRVEPDVMYHHYYERSTPTDEEIALIRTAVTAERIPPIHLLVLDGPDDELEATLRSLERQDYPDVGHAVVKASTDIPLPGQPDPRRLIGVLRAGEILAPAALWRFARASQGRGVTLAYSDHDSVDETGRHIDPWFVPDWSPDHALAQDYVGGLFLVRDSEASRGDIARLAEEADGWRYELLLASVGGAAKVVHVPEVLWSRPSWHLRDEEVAERELATVERALSARPADASVQTIHSCPTGAVRHVEWSETAHPLVSIIIPSTGRMQWVQQAIASLERTDYPRVEVIFIDNSRGLNPDGIEFLRGQDVTVLERDEPFNWARLNNDGARVATGDLLLFLNDDVEATDPDWLSTMVRQAARPEVGAVGSLLTYPDGSIQHAGVFLVGHGGGAVHLFRGLDPEGDLYLDLHRVAREVTAVTGACMLVPRDVFNQIGGFDEELAIVGNDVDLCLRIARTGRRVIQEPAATLVHHESQSRGGVDHFSDEGRMWERWSEVLTAGDSRYSHHLSQEREDASLAWSRVASHPDPIARHDPAGGVNLVGYIRAEMGIGEATRGEAAALRAAGVPFRVIDYQAHTPARLQDASWVHRIADQPYFDTNILHINADLLPRALGNLPPGLTEGRRNIGVWTWELPEFPEEWRGSFSLVDEVWVPSTFVRDAIGADAPVPVHVVPHAVRSPKGPFLGREHFGLPADTFQFLAMYDTQSVMERKNPQGAIRAFIQSFDPDDDSVSLVLKVNSAGDREVAGLRSLIANHPNVHLVTDTLSRHAVDSLMASSDAFVSLHRSEGFGLPIAEAMALGTAVIATGWSGNMDFMSEDVAACVDYRLVGITRSTGPYKAGQRWAEPDIDDAAAHMRRLREDGDWSRTIAEAARVSILESNSPLAVGRAMSARLLAKALG